MRATEAHEVMRLALAAARRARGRTHPNPMVGAVVVQGGQVVGVGHHARAGAAHAEVVALRRAAGRARGAEMVVTLEPCCHHGRTPPCTEAIVAAGIRRVWVAMRDPFEEVDGRGLRALGQAGVAVEVGIGAAAAARLNEAWLAALARRRPFVSLKVAESLDGKVACHTRQARWITSAAARRVAHRLRDASDAVLVGVGTVLADDPRLTCRLAGASGPRAAPRPRPPLRVVADSHLRTPPGARLFVGAGRGAPPVWIACGKEAPVARRRRLEAAGARVVDCPGAGARVDLRRLMAALFAADVYAVLVEGGPTLAGSLFDARLVDRLWTFIAPLVIGGAGAPGAVGGRGVASPAAAWRLAEPEIFAAGDDLGLTGRVVSASRRR